MSWERVRMRRASAPATKGQAPPPAPPAASPVPVKETSAAGAQERSFARWSGMILLLQSSLFLVVAVAAVMEHFRRVLGDPAPAWEALQPYQIALVAAPIGTVMASAGGLLLLFPRRTPVRLLAASVHGGAVTYAIVMLTYAVAQNGTMITLADVPWLSFFALSLVGLVLLVVPDRGAVGPVAGASQS